MMVYFVLLLSNFTLDEMEKKLLSLQTDACDDDTMKMSFLCSNYAEGQTGQYNCA